MVIATPKRGSNGKKPVSKKFLRLVLTGTPGTGKTTAAKAIAAATGARLIDANAIVKRKALWFNKARHEADLTRLKRALLQEIKASTASASPRGFVAEGHLLCEFALPCDACVVLRCDPRELVRRLKKRGYARGKIAENVLCEILDYCLVKAEDAYGAKKTIQIDVSNASKRVDAKNAKKLLDAVAKRRSDDTNWSSALLDERFKNGLGLS